MADCLVEMYTSDIEACRYLVLRFAKRIADNQRNQKEKQNKVRLWEL
jgi:hypothetical protein